MSLDSPSAIRYEYVILDDSDLRGETLIPTAVEIIPTVETISLRVDGQHIFCEERVGHTLLWRDSPGRIILKHLHDKIAEEDIIDIIVSNLAEPPAFRTADENADDVIDISLLNIKRGLPFAKFR